MKNGKANGQPRPFGFFSRFFRDEDLQLHEELERLRAIPAHLREIRLAVERGEMCVDDLDFDPDDPDRVEPENTQPEKP